MDSEFFKNARKWYNTIYVNPASERIVYFFIFIISIVCLLQSLSVMEIIKSNKDRKNTYVLFVDHKDPDSFLRVKQFSEDKDQILSILNVLITKYVLNMETLKYSNKETGMDAIVKKTNIIKNLSGKDVYDKYMENIYQDEGDMTLSILKIQKIAKVKKIEFVYDNVNVFEKIYSSILSATAPIGAKVYFSTETTDEKQKKQNYIAKMNFNFYIDSDRKPNSLIEFKVNDYYVEKDKNINENNNE